MERRNAWLSYTEAEEKKTGAGCKSVSQFFLMWEKQSVNV